MTIMISLSFCGQLVGRLDSKVDPVYGVDPPRYYFHLDEMMYPNNHLRSHRS